MSDPKWISREDVEEIHEVMIEIGGGAQGLRDAALLESALARPQNLHAYGEDDTFQLAASYAEGIARNHAFVDGNKRTAFATADLFLVENGHNLDQTRGHEHADMMEKLGQGQISRDQAATHFREHSRKLD
jgi:death-on-curing protein